MTRLEEIKSRFAACSIRIAAMDEHKYGETPCPLCDGDGAVSLDTFDTLSADGKRADYVGVQAFGIGKRLEATDTFLMHLADDMAWLIDACDEEKAKEHGRNTKGGIKQWS